MTFVKGQSGNPGGRAKGFITFRDEARQFMDRKGFALLIELAQVKNEFALKLLTEYAYGKPTQPVAVDPDGPALKVSVSFDHANEDAHPD